MSNSGRINRALLIAVLVALISSVASIDSSAWTKGSLASAAGGLDPTFGVGGIAVTDLGRSDVVEALALQNDGKTVAVGQTQLSTFPYSTRFALARYSLNGSLDAGFGTGGLVTTGFGGNESRAFAGAVQADGKVVVAGVASGGPTGADIALARYNGDGSLDPSFGVGGKVVTDFAFASTHEAAFDLAIQPDGKILVAGGTRLFGPITINPDNFALARYNPDGSLDPSFDGDGKVSTDFGLHDRAYGIDVGQDGKVVVAGVSTDFATQQSNTAIARFNANGSLDASFDGDGKVLTPESAPEDVVTQPDGKVVVPGVSPGSPGRLTIRRYAADGSLDSTFGVGGVASADFGTKRSWGQAVALQRDGKIVAGGIVAPDSTSSQPNDFSFAVARFDRSGKPDRSFHGGAVSTEFGTARRDELEALAIQRDGRIVAGGFSAQLQLSGEASSADFAIARYVSPSCRVPNVRGKKLARAKSTIRKARCSVGKITRKPSKRSKKGRVLSQRPKAGLTLAVGGKVNLVVGKGRRR